MVFIIHSFEELVNYCKYKNISYLEKNKSVNKINKITIINKKKDDDKH